ncbi:MAG: hypothetical protein RLZZ126_854 [Pseudomonadota bacterium]|jgi:RND family efflux transporter MFP subunit
MKPAIKWTLVALAAAGLAFGVARALQTKQAQQAAVLQLADKPVQTVLELGAGDVVQVQNREMSTGLPISGTLRAATSAVIKARVAGELQGLTVREGDAVRAGQVLAQVDPTEWQWRLRQAREQADAAKAQIDIAQRQYDNNRALVDQGFISRTALDTSSMSLVAAQATHRAALASVELANKSLDDTLMRSPIRGQVAQRLAQPGERVGVDTRVLEVVDLSRLELEATLAAADSVQLKPGQAAQLQVEGLAELVPAQVVRINPSAQASSRSVLAYLSVANNGNLRQGLFAQGSLATGRQSALVLPLSAVRTDKPRPYVQVLDQGKVRHIAVEMGARSDVGGDTVVAVTGLAAQTPVLTGSVGAVREGTQVRQAAAAR